MGGWFADALPPGLSLSDGLYVVCRGAGFILLLTAAGTPIFLTLFGSLLARTRRAIGQLGRRLASAALIVAAVTYALEAARMTGDFAGILDADTQRLVWHSGAGAAFVVRVAALTPMAVIDPAGSGARRVRAAPLLILAAVLLAVLSVTFTGHTVVNPHHWAAALLLVVHLLVIAFWIGALWPLYLAAGREDPATASHVIESFSVVATWLVPGILLAGIGLIVLLTPGLTIFNQPYGKILLGKTALFAGLMVLATLNKWTFGPACAAGETAGFRRTVLVEFLVICAVVMLTAVLTAFYSPDGA